MTKKDTEEKLLDLLSFMIQDHERHFDKETAQYLLNRIPTKSLLKPRRVHGIKNFVACSSIFGHVLLKNCYNISNDEYTIIDEWKEILKEKDPVLINNPDINFIPINPKEQTPKFKGELEIKSNFISYYAIKNFKEWFGNPTKEILGYKIDDINPALLTLECLCDEQDSYFYPGNKVDGESPTTKQSETYLKIIIKGKEEILKNKWHDEKSFTHKVFNSKRMKAVMKDVNGECLAPLFSEESLGAIIRQANSFNNLADNRELLSNLLALAPAEKWLEGARKVTQTKYVDIIDLFNNKFNYGYGINLHLEYKSGLRKEGKGYTKVAEVLKDELGFFFPALAKSEIDKNQLCLLVNAILRTRDVELMSIFLDSFDIPKVNATESSESHKIYSKMMSNMDDNIDSHYDDGENKVKFDNWHQAIAIIQAKKLDKELSVNETQPTKRKLKI